MPTVTLEISGELEQKLRCRAEAQGLDVAQIALEILKQRFYDPATTTNPNDLPFEVWRERFEQWVKNVPQVNVDFVDDSRETIYEGR